MGRYWRGPAGPSKGALRLVLYTKTWHVMGRDVVASRLSCFSCKLPVLLPRPASKQQATAWWSQFQKRPSISRQQTGMDHVLSVTTHNTTLGWQWWQHMVLISWPVRGYRSDGPAAPWVEKNRQRLANQRERGSIPSLTIITMTGLNIPIPFCIICVLTTRWLFLHKE